MPAELGRQQARLVPRGRLRDVEIGVAAELPRVRPQARPITRAEREQRLGVPHVRLVPGVPRPRVPGPLDLTRREGVASENEFLGRIFDQGFEARDLIAVARESLQRHPAQGLEACDLIGLAGELLDRHPAQGLQARDPVPRAPHPLKRHPAQGRQARDLIGLAVERLQRHLAQIWARSGDSERALKHAQSAFVLDPEDEPTRRALAALYITTKNYGRAVELLEPRFEIPKSPNACHAPVGEEGIRPCYSVVRGPVTQVPEEEFPEDGFPG